MWLLYYTSESFTSTCFMIRLTFFIISVMIMYAININQSINDSVAFLLVVVV